MPRRARKTIGGFVYHVLNRGCGRLKLFRNDGDYEAFERVLTEALQRFPGIRLLCYCLMPTHWHLVLWPTDDDELSRFMFWLTMTHVQRWRHFRGLVGLGPLYQGRFKAFPVETDPHYLTVCRYVERNALRAGLVHRGQLWKWCSLFIRTSDDSKRAVMLTKWPVQQPDDWLDWINLPQTAAEEAEVRNHIRTGRPFGSSAWQKRTAGKLGTEMKSRPPGRPRSGNKSKTRVRAN